MASQPASRTEKTAFAVFIMASARALTKGIDLVTLIVLARLLTREDFGLVATALVFVQITEVVFDAPIFVVLLRLRSVTRRHLDNLFALGVLRGVILCVLLCGLAYPLSLWYGDDRLVALICVLSLASAMRGIRSPRIVLTARRLNYLPESVADASGKLAALVIAVSVAVATGSYWSIAAGTVATPVVTAFVSFAILPYMPKWDLKHWPIFRGIMGWSMAGQAVAALNWQSDRMVLAKVTTLANVGLFSLARDLATNTVIAVVTTMMAPVNAALSAVTHDRRRLAAAYCQALGAMMSLTVPLAVGQALVADALIPLLLGPQWLDAIPIFQIICLAVVMALIVRPCSALFYAIGRPDMIFWRNFIDFCYRMPLTVILALEYGILGAAVALLISDFLMAIVCLVGVRFLAGISSLAQLRSIFRSAASSICMAGTVELLRLWLGQPGEHLAEIWYLAIMVPAAGLAYSLAHFVLWLLAGKPEGIESLALTFANRIWGRLGSRLGGRLI